MGFFSDLKFVKNYLNAQLDVEKFETDVSRHKENIKELNSKVFNLSQEIKELIHKKDELEESIKLLYEKKNECEKGINKIYFLESREFLQEFIDKGYEFYKLDLKEAKEENDKYYIPINIKREIDKYIQEFAILENLDFEYLRKILYDINKLWSECYEQISSVECTLYDNNITKVLLNFMMIRKKEILE